MIRSNKDIVVSVLTAPNRVRMAFPGDGAIQDHIQFGFSFVEFEDDLTAHVFAHPRRMKEILCGFSDAILDPEGEVLGRLWTADLISTKKLKENQIAFSNANLDVVLILDIPNNKYQMEG